MTTIRFRLVKLGIPEDPVKVYMLREDRNGIILSDYDLAVPIQDVAGLEDVEVTHLPVSMIQMRPDHAPITILPVQEVIGDTVVAAMEHILDAMEDAYGVEDKIRPELQSHSATLPTSHKDGGFDKICLASGLIVADPLQSLLAFCQEEYLYYDALPAGEANHIEPIDILATVSVNSFVNNAPLVRKVHRGLAAQCDPLLTQIPEHADLRSFDPALEIVERLLHSAVQAPHVLIPVATKVLHRKRRTLIPMLDMVVIKHYLSVKGRLKELGRTQYKNQAAGIAKAVLFGFREDLIAANAEIDRLREVLVENGFGLSNLRILEILVWLSTEERGYYRSANS